VLVTRPARFSLSLQTFIRSSVFSMPAVRSVVRWVGSIRETRSSRRSRSAGIDGRSGFFSYTPETLTKHLSDVSTEKKLAGPLLLPRILPPGSQIPSRDERGHGREARPDRSREASSSLVDVGEAPLLSTSRPRKRLPPSPRPRSLDRGRIYFATFALDGLFSRGAQRPSAWRSGQVAGAHRIAGRVQPPQGFPPLRTLRPGQHAPSTASAGDRLTLRLIPPSPRDRELPPGAESRTIANAVSSPSAAKTGIGALGFASLRRAIWPSGRYAR